MITTSQPSPGDVTDMWDELLKEYSEIVFIPMSSGLSNTCQTAALLAEDEPYAGKVFVVDNHRISVTQSCPCWTLSRWPVRQIRRRDQRDPGKRGPGRYDLHRRGYAGIPEKRRAHHAGRRGLGTILKLKPVLTIQGTNWIPTPKPEE